MGAELTLSAHPGREALSPCICLKSTEVHKGALVDASITNMLGKFKQLPLRFVGENLGLGVKWDAATKRITISN